MLTYEQKLDEDARWALSEGSRHFDQKSDMHGALRAIAQRLDQLQIPYAVVGGMSLFLQGFRQFTDDVHILVTADGLAEIHSHLTGLGYVPLFAGSRNLRDASNGVRIEFLVAGAYPGDGKPKPVAFPDPSANSVEIDGIRCLKLPRLIEIKLASGITNPGRLRDLADVRELIRHSKLERAWGDQLDPSVRAKFFELWDGLQQALSEP